MRDVRDRIAREFGGSLASATASTTNGQYGGNGKGASGQTKYELQARQDLRAKEANKKRRNGRAQHQMTFDGWDKLPKTVRDRVLEDSTITLAQLPFDKHGATIKRKTCPSSCIGCSVSGKAKATSRCSVSGKAGAANGCSVSGATTVQMCIQYVSVYSVRSGII
jgi:hypothetical protein